MGDDHDFNCVEDPANQVGKGAPVEMFFVTVIKIVYFIIERLDFPLVFRGELEFESEAPNPIYESGHHTLFLDFEEERHHGKADEGNAGKSPFNGDMFGGQSESRHGRPRCNEGGLGDGLSGIGADCRGGRCEP